MPSVYSGRIVFENLIFANICKFATSQILANKEFSNYKLYRLYKYSLMNSGTQ